MIKAIVRSLLPLIFTISNAFAQSPDAAATALYMANEGLMVVQGKTKILFDPLFRNSYGYYQLLPVSMKDALFAGALPFDGIDAVFVSHYHGDHFSPTDMLRLLKAQPGIKLYAPSQASRPYRKWLTVETSRYSTGSLPSNWPTKTHPSRWKWMAC